MKRACIGVMIVSCLVAASQVFAGDFAGELKGAFKSTVSAVYQETGKLYGVGPTLQGMQKFAYNNIVVNNYNAINGASTAITGVGIDKHLNNGYAVGVVNPLNCSIGVGDQIRAFQPGTDMENLCKGNFLGAPYTVLNKASNFITGTDIDRNLNNGYGFLVKDNLAVIVPLDMAKQLRTILPGFAVKQKMELAREPASEPFLQVSLYTESGTKEDAVKAGNRYNEKCVDDPHYRTYYADAGEYFFKNQCLLDMKSHNEISDYEIGYQIPQSSSSQLGALLPNKVNLSAGGR